VFHPLKWALRIVAALVLLVVGYLAVTFVQVWLASRRDDARPVQAIIVLGAAQYNGVPSAVLRARLDHAASLYHEGLADTVVVTGGKQPGDVYTEAAAAADYLARKGVPQDHVLRENGGRNSWQSLAAAAVFLKGQRRTSVLLVSDPFHSARVAAMASELGLDAYVSPTRTSPIRGATRIRHMGKETLEVAVGRIIGFRRLVGLPAKFGRVR
jgi:uncharacterized SAM-binding protein YcdF (DUF218 family)